MSINTKWIGIGGLGLAVGSLAVWSLAPRAEAQGMMQGAPDERIVAPIAYEELPLAPRALMARFSLRTPAAPTNQVLPLQCRVNAWIDVYGGNSGSGVVLLRREHLQQVVPMPQPPGELGTLDFGWNGDSLTISRNGEPAGTITPDLSGGSKVYISLAVDNTILYYGNPNNRKAYIPLGSTTIFRNGYPVQTIVSPRDSASGLPTG